MNIAPPGKVSPRVDDSVILLTQATALRASARSLSRELEAILDPLASLKIESIAIAATVTLSAIWRW